MSMIAEAKEALLTQLGVAGEPLEWSVPAIATQYARQVLMPAMSGPVARESHHWGLLLDLFAAGWTGGRSCRSRSPTAQNVGGARKRNEARALSVGLFDGVGARRVARDILGLPMAGHVSIEKGPKEAFPETEFFEDVVEFGAAEVAQLAPSIAT